MSETMAEIDARALQMAATAIERLVEATANIPGEALSNVTNDAIITRFFAECGREKPKFLKTRRNYFVDAANRLCFALGREAVEYGPSTRQIQLLAEYVGRRHAGGVLLLNGDGFDGWQSQQAQTDIRNRARQVFDEDHTPVVPYEALQAARIEVQTLKPIEVTRDVQETVSRTFELPFGTTISRRSLTTLLGDRMVTQHGHRERLTTVPSGVGTNFVLDWSENLIPIQVTFIGDPGSDTFTIYRVQGFFPTLEGEGPPAWFVLRPPTASKGKGSKEWRWQENVHHLGACVFKANGWDGREHRFISAFDQLEPEPLYYLAQLPDKGEVKSYKDAVDLLAPPIVHQARKEGKRVERQGDVFAIETKLTTRHIYSRAVTRVRRDVALQVLRLSEQEIRPGTTRRPEPNMRFTTTFQWVHPLAPFNGRSPEERRRDLRTIFQAPKEGEVTEEVPIPYPFPVTEGAKAIVGNGPAARRALQIFGTAHTADEVVVCENGITFIRGNIYHDAFLDEAGREPEHVIRNLDNKKWFLAVRNTVPRQADTPEQQQELEQVQEETAEAAASAA